MADDKKQHEKGNYAEARTEGAPSFFDFLTQNLGISSQFYMRLRDDTDWAIIIKLHALIEATLNHLLVNHFKDERLADIISFMPVWQGDASKMAFIKALGLMAEADRKYIKFLSAIRNKVAHKIKFVEFDMKNYVAGFNKDQKSDFRKLLQQMFGKDVALDGVKESPPEFLEKEPILAIVYGSFIVINNVFNKGQRRPFIEGANLTSFYRFLPAHWLSKSNPKGS